MKLWLAGFQVAVWLSNRQDDGIHEIEQFATLAYEAAILAAKAIYQAVLQRK